MNAVLIETRQNSVQFFFKQSDKRTDGTFQIGSQIIIVFLLFFISVSPFVNLLIKASVPMYVTLCQL